MRFGSQVTGYNSKFIQSLAWGSNYHIADHHGRIYLCNCCKRVLLSGKPRHLFPLKGSKVFKLKRNSRP